MGMYDSVMVPCPQCAAPTEFQSKSGRCSLVMFSLDDAPDDVLLDVNRHAPSTCAKCGVLFGVEIESTLPPRTLVARSVIWKSARGEDRAEDVVAAKRQEVHRVEFRLSMPGRTTWNGSWSGDGHNYAVVREVSDEDLIRLFGLTPEGFDLSKCRSSWTHRWSDGWIAEVFARVVPAAEELPRSDGFCGYNWMIDNILANGSPYAEVTS